MNPLTCTTSLAVALDNVGLPTMSDVVAPAIMVFASECRIGFKWSLQYFLYEGRVYQLNGEAVVGMRPGNYKAVVRLLSDESVNALMTVFTVFGFIDKGDWLGVELSCRNLSDAFAKAKERIQAAEARLPQVG